MSKKNKTEKEDDKYKLSKNLTPAEISTYREIGIPDLTQDWLEVFSPDLVQDLFTIKDSCSNNQKKSDYVEKELTQLGFVTLGLGTNIYTMYNPAYPGVVFKIALDDCGIADNFNDCILQDLVPRYNRVLARHPTSIVSVQERVVLIKDPVRMKSFRPQILYLLEQLTEDFLISDLSPDRFLNYGVGRDGGFIILDGSDLYPIELVRKKLRCTYPIRMKGDGTMKCCEGKLKYSEDFGELVCETCGRDYNPIDFRPSKEVTQMHDVITDGLSSDAREDLEQEEVEAITNRGVIERDVNMAANNALWPQAKPRESIFVKEEDGEDEDSAVMQLRRRLGSQERQVSVVHEDPDDEDDEDEDGEIQEAPSVTYSHCEGTINPAVAFDMDSYDPDCDPEPYDDSQDSDEDIEGERVEIMDVQGIFVTERISEMMLPAIVYKYELRGSDNDPGNYSTMEHNVANNFCGTILTLEEIYIPEGGSLKLRNHINFQCENCTLREFIDEQCNTESDNENACAPHIDYRIVPVNDENNLVPGIYLTISGDFEEAFEESGLPIYVKLEGDTGHYEALPAPALKRFIARAVNDIEEVKKETSDTIGGASTED